jgi:hypothetical protein
MTASVVSWSEFLAGNREVMGSILGYISGSETGYTQPREHQ